MLRDS